MATHIAIYHLPVTTVFFIIYTKNTTAMPATQLHKSVNARPVINRKKFDRYRKLEPPPPPGSYPLSTVWHDDDYMKNLLALSGRGLRYWLAKKYIYYSNPSGHRRLYNDADVQNLLQRCMRLGTNLC